MTRLSYFRNSKTNIESENAYVESSALVRTAYKRMLKAAKPGDMIILESLSDLGDSSKEIAKRWNDITKERKLHVKVLDIPLIDTTLYGEMAELISQILLFEEKSTKERQAKGIESARKRGVKLGRPLKPMPENFEEIYHRFLLHEPVSQLAKECPDISESTLRSRLKMRLDEENKKR